LIRLSIPLGHSHADPDATRIVIAPKRQATFSAQTPRQHAPIRAATPGRRVWLAARWIHLHLPPRRIPRQCHRGLYSVLGPLCPRLMGRFRILDTAQNVARYAYCKNRTDCSQAALLLANRAVLQGTPSPRQVLIVGVGVGDPTSTATGAGPPQPPPPNAATNPTQSS
jgi:hypothetical protein